MRLTDLLGEQNYRALLEEMLDPDTSRAPAVKGPNAIKVSGYVVHGHWRRHPPPRQKRADQKPRRLKLVPGR